MQQYKCLDTDIRSHAEHRAQSEVKPDKEDRRDFSSLTQEQKKVVFGGSR